MYFRNSGGAGLGSLAGGVWIPAQNTAGDALAALVTQWQAAKNGGTLTLSLAQSLSGQVTKVGDDFYNYTMTINDPGARTGGRYIQNLANGIAVSIMKDVATVAAPPQQVLVSQPLPDTAITPGAAVGTVSTITRTTTGAPVSSGSPYDTSVPGSVLPSSLPDWLLPAAAGFALVMMLRR